MKIIFLLLLKITIINTVLMSDDSLNKWKSMNDHFFDKNKKCSVELCINGRIFEFIDIAFNDYIKDLQGTWRKRKLYSFYLSEERGGIVVHITINNANTYQEYKRVFHGGSAEYLIDKKSKKILDSMLYK